MDLKKLLGMRPKGQTAADIHSAIAQAEAGKASALARAAELEAERGNLLLTGDIKAVETGERELAEARAEAERCTVMAEALRAPLAEAVLRERAAEIVALHQRAEQASEEFATWWRTKYGALATEIRDALRQERIALNLIHQLHMLTVDEPAAFAAAGVGLPKSPSERVSPHSPSSVIAVAMGVRLVSVDRDTSIWPEDRH
ncbi:hypothetical protein [Muricoccus radiodurans]|uniref:hypothetical protein n=1 Tax=Muricoccus radiodurans TaxID=2231721 RepID=UPI003CF93144